MVSALSTISDFLRDEGRSNFQFAAKYMKRVQIKTEYNQLLTMNPAHKSGDAWVGIASSVQSRQEAH
jgi:hypothetical protein